MFLCRYQKSLLRTRRLFTKTYQTVPYYQFSQNQNQNQDQHEHEHEQEWEEQKQEGSSFPLFTTLFGSIVAGGIGYAFYKDYTKKSSSNESSQTQKDVEPSPAVLQAIIAYGKNSLEVASILKQEGLNAYKFGSLEDSVRLYNDALKIYSTAKGPESEEVAQLNRDLGASYSKLDKIDEAKAAFKKSSDIFFHLNQNEQGFEQLEQLALSHVDDFAKAKELFEDIIKQRKEKIGKKDPLLAKTYIRYAGLYSTQQMQEDVLDKLKQAFSLMKSNKIPNDQLSTVYQELSTVYRSINAYNEALSAIQKAISYLDVKKDAEKIASLTKKAAIIYSQQRNVPKSIENFKLYIDRVKHIDDYKLDVGDTYRRIAMEYEKMNKFDEAIQNYDKYIEIFRNANKTEVAITGKMRTCSLYLKAKKTGKGVDCFEDAFIWASKELGEDHKLSSDSFEILKSLKQAGVR